MPMSEKAISTQSEYMLRRGYSTEWTLLSVKKVLQQLSKELRATTTYSELTTHINLNHIQKNTGWKRLLSSHIRSLYTNFPLRKTPCASIHGSSRALTGLEAAPSISQQHRPPLIAEDIFLSLNKGDISNALDQT